MIFSSPKFSVSNLNETDGKETVAALEVNGVLEQDFFLCQAGDTIHVTEEALSATRTLVSAVVYELPFTKNRYLVLSWTLVDQASVERV